MVGEGFDHGFGAIEDRDCAAAALAIAVDIGEFRRQEPVGMAANLMRRSVIDAQRIGPAANIDAERFPGEWLLKYPLPEIAGQEQPIGARRSDGGQKAQLGDPDILRLIDDSEIEDPLAAADDLVRQPAEHIRPGDDVALRQPGAHLLEDRPQAFPLLAADPRLAAEAGHIAICLPTLQLPGIDESL